MLYYNHGFQQFNIKFKYIKMLIVYVNCKFMESKKERLNDF
jgi:hypothetical protein